MLEEFLFQSIFRDATDPVVLLDRDRTVKTANPAFRAVTRRGRDGTDFMDLVSFHARDRVLRDLVRAAAGDEVLIEVPHVQENESDVVVEYRFYPVESGRVAGMGRVREPDQALREQLGRAKEELQQKSRLLDEIQMELTQVPFIDTVTGVWNRLQVIERLASEWSRTERWGSPLSCLLIDIESAAGVRRKHGAAVADEILRAAARRVKSVARDHDIVGRYGGDRFVVIAVHCDAEGAKTLAHRVRECFRAEPIAVAGRVYPTEVRIGGSTNRSDGVEIMEDLFTVAEGALLDARNRAQYFACAEEPA